MGQEAGNAIGVTIKEESIMMTNSNKIYQLSANQVDRWIGDSIKVTFSTSDMEPTKIGL